MVDDVRMELLVEVGLIWRTPQCELSLDPEVAILFGREIGQSNCVFYLLVMNLQG
jgi:hypothetical protein